MLLSLLILWLDFEVNDLPRKVQVSSDSFVPLDHLMAWINRHRPMTDLLEPPCSAAAS